MVHDDAVQQHLPAVVPGEHPAVGRQRDGETLGIGPPVRGVIHREEAIRLAVTDQAGRRPGDAHRSGRGGGIGNQRIGSLLHDLLGAPRGHPPQVAPDG